MLVIPLLFIVVGYIIYLKKYKVDETFYNQIVGERKEKGALGSGAFRRESDRSAGMVRKNELVSSSKHRKESAGLIKTCALFFTGC